MRGAIRHEVEAEFVSFTHPRTGEAVHLRQGQELPDWVLADQVQQLIKNNAVSTYEEI